MFSTFDECAPYVVAMVAVIAAVSLLRMWKNRIYHTDTIIALVGVGLGIVITFINLVYSNQYLITLGPILTFICLFYLSYREQLLSPPAPPLFVLPPNILRIIGIIFWMLTAIIVILYYHAPVYTRSVPFFVLIALCIVLLGFEALYAKPKGNIQVFGMFIKIIFLSLILRASAYYISPFPVGQDPWAHTEYVKNFLNFGYLEVGNYHRGTGVTDYYVGYPIMHLYAVSTDLICNLCVKDSMFIVGVVLTVSTVFVFLIVKHLVNNVNMALFSMLLINFADFHIQWSIQIISMTFGIAVFTILIYAIVSNWKKPHIFYPALMLVCMSLLVWTHTVSTFVALTSLFVIFIAGLVYPVVYNVEKGGKNMVPIAIITFFIIILMFKWLDPSYLFLENILKGLVDSVSAEAEFLGRAEIKSDVNGLIGDLSNIIGFLMLVTFGILGSLSCLSDRYINKAKFSLILMICALFFVFFVFPLFGLRNIVPYRWPAFIYVVLVLFVTIGLVTVLNLIRHSTSRRLFLFTVLFIISIFMTTNFVTNLDSPIFGKDQATRSFLHDSEICICLNAIDYSDFDVVTDDYMVFRPLMTLKPSSSSKLFKFLPSGEVDWDYLHNKMILWRKQTLDGGVSLSSENALPTSLGSGFKHGLDRQFDAFYDVGSVKAYLGKGS